MSIYEPNDDNDRKIGITRFKQGYLDFKACSEPAITFWSDRCEEFRILSLQPPPNDSDLTPAWSPAYIVDNGNGHITYRADMIVFDLHGCSVNHLHQLLFDNNLTGLAYATKSDGLMTPHSLFIIVLDRTVNYDTYMGLWRRIAREVFNGIPAPAHADFRQRYNQPHSTFNRPGKSTMRRHDGSPLCVNAVMAAEFLDADSLGDISSEYTVGYYD